MRETDDFYFFWEHQFGQWTKRDMVDPEGVTYNCCEQYMMVKKAQLFNDAVMAETILNESSPKKQQQLGREIKGFDPKQWDQNRYGIVWYGNYLKFTQHEDLKQRLLATGDKIMAEASPYDLVWGVGFKAEDDAILNMNNWKGLNLLGKALMSVRDSLRVVM